MTSKLPPSGPKPALDEDLTRQLDRKLGTEQPGDEAVLERVRARLMKQIAAESQSRLHTTVRTGEQPWEQLAPGIERKVLFTTPTSLSCLLRLAPGARIPGHLHPIDEECLVLEGSARIGTDLVLQAGDFHVGMQGVPHAGITTETGAVVFLREGRGQAVGA